ncbi:MAG: AMP-binding protein [Oligoflexia bacterium]|nr:AMP-binding protein [Oligoflexia bacterium]
MMSPDQNQIFSKVKTAALSDPQKVVIRDQRRNWTWSELLSEAFQYKVAIEKANLETRFIPVFTNRSGDVISALLGVLLAGKAFAPLSPEQPEERIQKCLEALDAKSFIGVGESSRVWRERGLNQLEKDSKTIDWTSIHWPQERPLSEILYVLFTSGSTGTPKGVQVSYSNIINTMEWSKDILDWNPDDRIGIAANFYFDISMFDFFTLLFWNVGVAVFSDTTDMGIVIEEIEKHKITSIFSAPIFFSQFLRSPSLTDPKLESLRRIISGGDFFPPAHIRSWLSERPQTKVYNVWGPTETSIVNTMHLVTESDLPRLEENKYPSIGRSHPRMPLVLIDQNGMEIKNPGIEGEIWMLGPCVTQGYLGDPEKTAASYTSFNGQRAYRTQDIGTLDEEGNLYMVGRMGSLVKVAGYRIDLGEVEAAASRIKNVHLSGAFVIEVQDGIQELWLGLEIASKEEKADIFGIKNQLRKLLPNYMVPKRILLLKNLPKSPNGKIDRKALKAQAIHELNTPTH